MNIMKKVIKVKLSLQELSDLKNRVINFKDNLNQLDSNIVNKLADFSLNEIQNNFSATDYKDGNDDVAFFKKGTKKSKTVGMSGTQVLYDEFGTGEEGAKSGHEMKGDFPLNPYNSGRTIRRNKNSESNATANGIPVGGLYWTYKDKNGQKRYTQGIPAGKQVLNAAIALRKQKNKIIKKEVSDALSKL